MKFSFKKIFAFAITFVLLFNAISLSAFALNQDVDIDVGEYSNVEGDINNDGVFGTEDLVVSAKIAAGWTLTPGAVNAKFVDANSDGKENLSDTVLLARKLADWDVTLYPSAE